jgi:hypothetical protein
MVDKWLGLIHIMFPKKYMCPSLSADNQRAQDALTCGIRQKKMWQWHTSRPGRANNSHYFIDSRQCWEWWRLWQQDTSLKKKKRERYEKRRHESQDKRSGINDFLSTQSLATTVEGRGNATHTNTKTNGRQEEESIYTYTYIIYL